MVSDGTKCTLKNECKDLSVPGTTRGRRKRGVLVRLPPRGLCPPWSRVLGTVGVGFVQGSGSGFTYSDSPCQESRSYFPTYRRLVLYRWVPPSALGPRSLLYRQATSYCHRIRGTPRTATCLLFRASYKLFSSVIYGTPFPIALSPLSSY